MSVDASAGSSRSGVFYPKADCGLSDEQLQAWRGEGAAHVPASIAESLADVCAMFLGGFPESIVPLAEQGTFHRLLRITTDAGSPVIARVARPDVPEAARSLLVDAWAHRRLRVAGFPSLEVVAVDVSCSLAPFAFELLAEAPGQTLRGYDDNDDVLQPLLADLGRRLAELHQLPTAGFGLLHAELHGANIEAHGDCRSWPDYLAAQFERHLALCRDIGTLERDESARIEKLWADGQAELSLPAGRMLHGDLGNHNLFTDGAQITHLIDWEDCLAGDPVFDLAFWATFHPERRHHGLLESYCEHVVELGGTLPVDFRRRFWLYFLRISLAKTVLRHRLGIVDVPGRAPASLRIQRALTMLETNRAGTLHAA